MKTVLNIEKFNSGKIANYVNNAQSAGSDNGLSANYRTAIIPVIVSKKIASSGTEFGAFVTALFDENGEFVKTGAVSMNSVFRLLRLCEDMDKLPEDFTQEMINKLPTVELIEGCNRANGKSLFEVLQNFHKNNLVIVKKEERQVIAQNFKDNKPVVEGTTIRKRNIFTTEEDAEIYAKLPEVYSEIFEAKDDTEIKKYFEAAGIDYNPKR
jgi:hypothetical protein